MKRVAEVFLALIALLFLIPLFLIIALLVVFDSKGGAFYTQPRVGRFNHDFRIIKFRTMKTNSDRQGLITTGSSDNRVTRAGRILRKYKLDELPQLINILAGDMSFIGPRPEVRKYVDLYTEDQLQVLTVKPGLTDYASVEYIDEEEILARHADPEKVYVQEIMPAKLALNLEYINDQSPKTDFRILLRTIRKIFRGA